MTTDGSRGRVSRGRVTTDGRRGRVGAPSALFRCLAFLALLGQVLAGALVVPDDARAVQFAAMDASHIMCGAPASHRHDHPPGRPEPACALSLSLTPHAAPLASPVMVPLPARAVAAGSILRPLARAPPPRRLRPFAPSRGPPFGT